MNIGEQIKKYRIKANLSQRELGMKLGISQQQIAQYENGTRVPKIETVKKMAVALEVDISDISEYLAYKDEVIENSPLLSALRRLGTDESNFGRDITNRYMIDELKLEEDKKKLLYIYNQLNQVGKKEAIKRVEELAEIPRYTEIEKQKPSLNHQIKNATTKRTTVHPNTNHIQER